MEDLLEDTTVVEEELLSNRREVEVEPFGTVVLKRATPAEDHKIAEAKRKSYHADLRDPDILTRKQLEKIFEDRGVWTEEDAKELKDLGQESTKLMTQLTALGFTTVDALFEELVELKENLTKEFSADEFSEQADEVEELLEQLFIMGEDKQVNYTAGSKLRKIANTPKRLTLIAKAENAIFTIRTAVEFSEVKQKLNDKSTDFMEYFAGSAEVRADRVERLAKLFYCIESKETGKPLWKDLEEVWHEDKLLINKLETLLFYFENAVTSETAEILEKYGFMARVTDTEDSSESSQGHPMSNSDGDSVESEPQNSSDADTPTS